MLGKALAFKPTNFIAYLRKKNTCTSSHISLYAWILPPKIDWWRTYREKKILKRPTYTVCFIIASTRTLQVGNQTIHCTTGFCIAHLTTHSSCCCHCWLLQQQAVGSLASITDLHCAAESKTFFFCCLCTRFERQRVS